MRQSVDDMSKMLLISVVCSSFLRVAGRTHYDNSDFVSHVDGLELIGGEHRLDRRAWIYPCKFDGLAQMENIHCSFFALLSTD